MMRQQSQGTSLKACLYAEASAGATSRVYLETLFMVLSLQLICLVSASSSPALLLCPPESGISTGQSHQAL